ncbi:MAG: hypothetical protein V4653_10635 [Pseudomonadota bacterium]
MSTLPVALCLDLASTTGWCLGRFGEEPSFGAWSLGADSYTNRYQRLADSILSKVEAAERRDAPITRIFFEAPLPRAQRDVNVAALAFGLAAITCYVAGRLKIHHAPKHIGQARLAVLGTGRFAKGVDTKAEVDRLCRLQGWNIDQHDARDAFVVWKACELDAMGRAGLKPTLTMRRETLALPGL